MPAPKVEELSEVFEVSGAEAEVDDSDSRVLVVDSAVTG